MKNLTKEQLLFIRKCIGAGCIFVCLLLMFLHVFSYTSSSSLKSGGDVTWSDGISLYSFLFSTDLLVVYDKIEYIREFLVFSNVVMWVSFVAMVAALGVSIYGIFSKNILFSKIASIGLMAALGILLFVIFDIEKISNTTKYLSVLTPSYLLVLAVGGLGLFSTITIKNK